MWQKVSKICVVIFLLAGIAFPVAAYESGDRGAQVLMIQKKLRSYGYKVNVDGVYGKETVRAVQRFQADKGLQIDGVVGPNTYLRLTGAKMPQSSASKFTSQASSWNSNKPTFSSFPGSDVGYKLVETANHYRGVPYVFGGNTPSGFDCSGFTKYVFQKEGIQLPRMADEQYLIGSSIPRSRLLPGDLVFFTTYEPGASHTGIYVGDGQFISATSSGGVRVDSLSSSYWASRYLGAKRVR